VTPFSLVTNYVMSHMRRLVTFTFSLMTLALIPGRGKRLFSSPNLSTVAFVQSFCWHFLLTCHLKHYHDHWQSAPFSDSKLLSKLEHITKVMCLYSFTLKALLINTKKNAVKKNMSCSRKWMILLRSSGCSCESVDRSNQRFKSSRMSWCAIEWTVLDILTVTVFSASRSSSYCLWTDCLTQKMKALWTIKMSGATCPVMQHHSNTTRLK
jgi:hypothetical protein